MDLLLRRQTKALDGGNLVEEGRHRLLVNLEGQVTDKEGVALGAHLIVELLGTVVGASGRVLLGLASRQVDSHVATIKEGAVLLLKGSVGVLSRVKVDVAEATGTALLVHDDTGTSDTSAVLELLVEKVVVDLPAQVTHKEGRALAGSIVGLGLLGRGLLLVISLALLGGGILLRGLLLRGLGLLGVGVAVGVGVGVAVLRLGLLMKQVSKVLKIFISQGKNIILRCPSWPPSSQPSWRQAWPPPQRTPRCRYPLTRRSLRCLRRWTVETVWIS